MINDLQRNLPKTWPFFVALVMTLVLLLAGVFAMHFYFDYRSESTRLNSHETLNVRLARNALVEDISSVSTDLMLLQGLLQSPDLDAQKNDSMPLVTDIFMTFAREKGMYDQVRFLDLEGREVVRVNWNNGNPQPVGTDLLQDKSNRYYVWHALDLDHHQIYLSPLDLNVESNKIEQPAKPVLRFATPFFNHRQEKAGLLVLNYLGTRLLDRFRLVSANIADHVQLVNQDGYWLSSPVPGKTWGFMYNRPETFQTAYPAAWEIISGYNEGQFKNSNGVFTFATVSPVKEASRLLPGQTIPGLDTQQWKVVSHVDANRLITGFYNFLAQHAKLYLGFLTLLTILAYLVASGHAHRRRAEAQQAYEQKFRRILEDIELAALMVDMQGNITFCNRFLLQLTGWTADRIVGQNWINNFIPGDQQDHINDILREIRKDIHSPQGFEGEIRTKSGDRRLMSWHYTESRDSEGKVSGVTAIGEDVTEKRRAEEQVRVLSRAVDQSPASVIITSYNGLIEYVNPKFTKVTGYSPHEVLGKNPRILKSGETPSAEYSELWQALRAGGEWRGEFHNRRKDGSLYWEAAVITALRDMDGNITHFLAVKEDITERKRLEQEVDYRNLELSRAQALTAMGKMASMLAHDLSNPLSSVKMAVQMMGKQSSSEDAKELANISQEQINYMESIITEMLTYARPGELESSWLDAENLLNSAISTVQKRIAEFSIEVSTHCTPGLPTFPGDASKLRQLLSNLMMNAFRATAAQPESDRRVQVSVELDMLPSGRHIRFSVCDNGEGIGAEIKERIFEPFFTTHSKGTGLGLAIVKQVADLHGGLIEFSSNHPRGTCAMLSLPLTPVVSTRQKSRVTLENEREIA